MKERKRKLQDRLKTIKDAKIREGKGRGRIDETLEQEQENEIERLEQLQKVPLPPPSHTLTLPSPFPSRDTMNSLPSSTLPTQRILRR
jgi:hypothetical protein